MRKVIPIHSRKGQSPGRIDRESFRQRYLAQFADPAFQAEAHALDRLEQIAWEAYQDGRKAPVTRKAGSAFQDPDYPLSTEWLATHKALEKAQASQRSKRGPDRVLVISGSARNDGTCPGENAKSWRMAQAAVTTLRELDAEVDLLDLSLMNSEPHLHIHPCKGCASTAMPLCHWPCSCYPNHAMGQVNDAMSDIYERWVRAHGVLIVTPTYWYQSPSPLKLMIDRLVCADGGNPDPTTTHGKKIKQAKALEHAGWDFPKHLAGRAYGVVVHGDVAGIESQRRNLCDWLGWMGLISAGASAQLDRYIGYYEPYADSHAALDHDTAVMQETRNAAEAVAKAVRAIRRGTLRPPDDGIKPPRPK